MNAFSDSNVEKDTGRAHPSSVHDYETLAEIRHMHKTLKRILTAICMGLNVAENDTRLGEDN